jgi:hypothetical protein
MIAIIIFAVFATLMLALLLARFGPRRTTVRNNEDPRAPIPPAALRAIVVDLLKAMGMRLAEGPEAEGVLVGHERRWLGEWRPRSVIAVGSAAAACRDVRHGKTVPTSYSSPESRPWRPDRRPFAKADR